MDPLILAALARHLLTVIGGVYGAKYGLDKETSDAAIAGVTTIGGIAWSIYEKRQRTVDPLASPQDNTTAN